MQKRFNYPVEATRCGAAMMFIQYFVEKVNIIK